MSPLLTSQWVELGLVSHLTVRGNQSWTVVVKTDFLGELLQLGKRVFSMQLGSIPNTVRTSGDW